jgi:hypothetical protein
MPIDRSRIRKGIFLVSDQPLPGCTPNASHCRRSLSTSSRLAEAADRLQAIDRKYRAAIEELTRRLEMVRQQLDGFKAAKRR